MSRFAQRLAALEASRVPDPDARTVARSRLLEAVIRAEAPGWGVRDADMDRFVADVFAELEAGPGASPPAEGPTS